ncbi:MAG: NAD(P)/FAD-dependent oxidoreductase [Methyloligellaceae bacterium]
MTSQATTIDGEPLDGLPETLWHHLAGAPPADQGKFAQHSTDLVVVGGGITGLSAALRAREAGLSVTLLEQGQVGWGASGRNGGSVVVGLKGDPRKILSDFGEERGARLIAFAQDGPRQLYDAIKSYGIACDLHHGGHITAFHTPKAKDRFAPVVEAWTAYGAPVKLLDRGAIGEKTGSELYVGGLQDDRCANLNPLKLVFGLVRAAIERGVTVNTGVSVNAVKRDGRSLVVKTDRGAVITDSVILALNAYADKRFPQLSSSFLNPTSCIVATRVLSETEIGGILPDGAAAADSRRVLNYFRRTPDGRVMLGGRGPMSTPSKPASYRSMAHSLRTIYPQLKDVEIDLHWFGRLSIAMDFHPHVEEIERGVLVLNGYAGRGLALGAQLGRYAVDRLANAGSEAPIDLFDPLRRVPLHCLQRIYVAAGGAFYRTIDLVS